MLAKINKTVQRTWANISYRKLVNLRLKAPVISFTFDDAPASAFVNGGGLLNEFGYRGTFYVALSLLEKGEDLNHFDTQHLQIARQQGHELACHTHDHLDISQVAMTDLKRDIQVNQRQIDQVIPGYAFRNFAFPFGAQTRSSKQWLATQYRSARGNRHGINQGQVDLMNLKGVRLYENSNSPNIIQHCIEQAMACNGWLIFYTHAVESPATPDGCSPAYFKQALEMCKQNNLRVLPVDEVLYLIKKG